MASPFVLSSDSIYRVPELSRIPWLIHGFGTRHSDVPAMIPELATVKQIHSAICLYGEGRHGVIGQGDALIENTPGAAVAIKTADCLPILLVDERRRAVAAVHAGWRGTVARVAPVAIEAMRARFGTDPADLHAAIGPGIGVCCFEVGPEVSAEFAQQGRTHIDLVEHNRHQLKEMGVTPSRIYASSMCTKCSNEFHSFRRDREAAGRMYSYAGLRADAGGAVE